jgi:YVTN family beta-propeller protein
MEILQDLRKYLSYLFKYWMFAISIIKSKYDFLFALLLGMTVIISVFLVAFNNVNARTLESINQQKKLLGNIPQLIVGSSPIDIQVNPKTSKIYVANRGSDSVSVIDSNSGNIKNIRVGVAPVAIAIDKFLDKIYVANQGSDSVSVLDGYNDSVTGKIPVGEAPSAITIDRSGSPIMDRIYVANMNSHSVSVINATNDSIIGNIWVGPNNFPLKIVVGPSCAIDKPHNIYVGSGVHTRFIPNGGVVSVINSTNSTNTKEIPTLFPAEIMEAGHLSPDIYVVNGSSLSIIQPCTGKTHNIHVGLPGAIAVGPMDRIYVVNDSREEETSLSIIDPISGKTEPDIHIGNFSQDIALQQQSQCYDCNTSLHVGSRGSEYESGAYQCRI